MTYHDALKAADPVAAVIGLAVVMAEALGGFAALGWDEATVLLVAGALFTAAASIRTAVNRKLAKEAAAGGVLR